MLLDVIERYLYRRSHRIISLLPEAEPYMVNKGADADRIGWIPNGVDLDMVPAPTPPVGDGAFCIMYAGAHGLANGLDVLLDAAVLVQEDGWGTGSRRLPADGGRSREGSIESPCPAGRDRQRGIPRFSYMACARPEIFAVGTNVNSVDQSNCGITVPPENPGALVTAVNELVKLPAAERWKMGCRGRQYVEEHHALSRLAKTLERTLQAAVTEDR